MWWIIAWISLAVGLVLFGSFGVSSVWSAILIGAGICLLLFLGALIIFIKKVVDEDE